jgi:broad specificity phosphatase PhoE
LRSDIPITYDERLREKNSGIYEGRNISELRHSEDENNEGVYDFIPEGGESFR